jgi:hypothetical protein
VVAWTFFATGVFVYSNWLPTNFAAMCTHGARFFARIAAILLAISKKILEVAVPALYHLLRALSFGGGGNAASSTEHALPSIAILALTLS